ncbi:phospholipase D-like domain-containing protein [Sphingosinicella rhizophila]|uniref:Phospholipase D n=1 Tax=Sphingosinicella rhizophila TaxID=3050082 RepID=A0ABU3Q8B7_9SPHN|nr:phosphatidylserine/phosphatidylglycerophosphate/cardiolipin synthase family protein [Sphingosinicella sp. GR2756]MDT9599660.1 phosphatidylserine/phosphatidylglycerophosphate/cardiolipin synthase family protein [Sphingosinicella sp. GR2756]
MADENLRETGETVSIDVGADRLTLLADGPARLDALIDLIEGASTSLRVLYYIFQDDASSTRVRDALIAAAKRGVRVSMLVDGFGSTSDRDFLAPLLESKIGFCRFSPKFGRRYLLRNHQKLALADRRTVLIGGFNVSDEYFGTVESGAWRDLGLRVEGGSVDCLAGYFDDLFAWATKPGGRIRELRRLLQQHSVVEGRLHWLFGGPTRRLSPWARAVRRDMASARRLDLIAAYFAPSLGMLRRMARVARRGEVRLVTAAKSDNKATIGAARNTYWWLLKRGVEIFEYQPTKLHTKLFVVDDVVHIGSANFDMRSLYLNLEMMLRVDDPGFAAAMRRFVDGEIASSKKITLASHRRRRTFFNRLKWAVAYFLVAVADYRISRGLNFGAEKSTG